MPRLPQGRQKDPENPGVQNVVVDSEAEAWVYVGDHEITCSGCCLPFTCEYLSAGLGVRYIDTRYHGAAILFSAKFREGPVNMARHYRQ